MFKVEEGDDGKTTIYCKNTGRLLCTVPPTKNSRVPRKVNVVKPQQVCLPASTTKLNFTHHYKVSDDSSCSSIDDEAFIAEKKPLEPEIIEDFSDDCISEEQFARCLNLVSSTKFAKEPFQKLLHEHPLRHVGKSTTFRYNVKVPKGAPPIYESVPITSQMGMIKMKLNFSKYFIKQPAIEASFKNYEAYCRQPFNAQPNGYQFPKLRCREKKIYPICISDKIKKTEYYHCFTYGRRQRKERIRDLDTGLTRRGRRLLDICNRKPLKVQLETLSPATINAWTTGTPSSASTANSKIIISFPLHKFDHALNCHVKLPDVLQSIEKRPSGYYVSKTNIQVTNFPLPSSARPRSRRTVVLKSSRTSSTKDSKALVLQTPFPRSSSSSLLVTPFSKVGAPLRVNGRSFPAELKAIPIIDLTQESSPTELGLEPETVVDNWLFKCFACGLVRYYYNPSYKDDLRKHMSHYHSIPDPEKFLYRYMDRVNKRTVIEAFPGCKTQDRKPLLVG